MPSRVIRDALLESDRWLGLAHPAERLAYMVLLLKADDLATADASDGQLVRLWREPCNLKGPEDAQRLLNALADADLVRIYEADGKRLVFIPRFRQRFRARTLKRPPPPENLLNDEPEILENIRQINNRVREMTVNGLTDVGQLADNGQTVAPVGVGVGVVEDVGDGGAAALEPSNDHNHTDHHRTRKRATSLPVEFTITETMREWATGEGLNPTVLQSETEKFLDHHRSKGNTFKDWEAAWRNWMRKAIDWSKPGLAKNQASSDIYTPAKKAVGAL